MSVQAIGWILEHSEATGNVRLVLISIANHAGARGERAWPSIARLARESRCSASTVKRALRAAEAIGELHVYEQEGEGRADRRTSRYELPRVPGWEAPRGILPRTGVQSDTSIPVDNSPDGGSPVTPRDASRGVKSGVHGGSPVTPDPSLEIRPKETTASADGGPIVDNSVTSPEFEALWRLYPRRAGGNPRGRAWKAFRARVADGHTATDILRGVERYARWCRATDKVGSELVQQAATFLGPDCGFSEDWGLPKDPGRPAEPDVSSERPEDARRKVEALAERLRA